MERVKSDERTRAQASDFCGFVKRSVIECIACAAAPQEEGLCTSYVRLGEAGLWEADQTRSVQLTRNASRASVQAFEEDFTLTEVRRTQTIESERREVNID